MANNNNLPSSDSPRRNGGGGGLTRFLNDIKDFGGSTNGLDHSGSRLVGNPLTWLKKLDRLKELAHLSDKEVLLIAADHLVGKAEAWFDVACKEIQTWSAFSLTFKKKYCVGMEDIWWSQIRHMKQGPSESVDDIDIKLRELFSLVQVTDERLMVRSFLDAIEPGIAWEVERNNMTNKTPSLDEVVASATRYEMVMSKYQAKGVAVFSKSSETAPELRVSKPPFKKAFRPDQEYEVQSEDSASTFGELLKEFRELKISLVQTVNNAAVNNTGINQGRNSRNFTCFFCKKEGHRKPDCPEWLAMRKEEESPATGPNAIPVNTGKDMGLRL